MSQQNPVVIKPGQIVALMNPDGTAVETTVFRMETTVNPLSRHIEAHLDCVGSRILAPQQIREPIEVFEGLSESSSNPISQTDREEFWQEVPDLL